MLPFLIKSEGQRPLAGRLSEVPPLHFRPLSSRISNIRLHRPVYQRAEGVTDSQKLGLKYEARVHEWLRGIFPHYHAGPYIHFLDDQVARTCQPDALLFLGSYIFLFEMKYQHCPEAWWQLEKLYAPLLRQLYPSRPVSCVEICRSYDPSTPFPCEVSRVEDLIQWTSESRDTFGVFQWRR